MKKLKNKGIYVTQIETPIGTMLTGANEKGVCFLEFIDGKTVSGSLSKFSCETINQKNSHLHVLSQELEEYFNGVRTSFTVSISVESTLFQMAVWEILQNIPYGSTISYKQQSVAMKNPDAIRAIASANGKNPIAIIIPCHRVISENGNLTGYSGGLWRKKWLLDFEKQVTFGMTDLFNK